MAPAMAPSSIISVVVRSRPGSATGGALAEPTVFKTGRLAIALHWVAREASHRATAELYCRRPEPADVRRDLVLGHALWKAP